MEYRDDKMRKRIASFRFLK